MPTQLHRFRLMLTFVTIVACIMLVVIFFNYGSRPINGGVVFDDSKWGRYFLSASGFQGIRMHVYAGSRAQTDYISLVGRGRPTSWFAKMGFTNMRTKKGGPPPARVAICLLSDRERSQPHLRMGHPKLEWGETFHYFPEIGILAFSVSHFERGD